MGADSKREKIKNTKKCAVSTSEKIIIDLFSGVKLATERNHNFLLSKLFPSNISFRQEFSTVMGTRTVSTQGRSQRLRAPRGRDRREGSLPRPPDSQARWGLGPGRGILTQIYFFSKAVQCGEGKRKPDHKNKAMLKTAHRNVLSWFLEHPKSNLWTH